VPVVYLSHLTPMAAVVDDNSAAYDLVLLAHVLSALVGLVAVVVSGGFALALRGALSRGGPVPEAVARYFRPGTNWVGRVLFAVPVLGIALVAMSNGQWGYSDAWIDIGLAGWAAVAMVAEGILWPTERRLQEVVSSGGAPPEQGWDPEVLCLQAGVVALGLAVVLVVISVVMVAKP
jgi:hypothetical protein